MDPRAFNAGKQVAKYEIRANIHNKIEYIKTIIQGPNIAYNANSKINPTTRNVKEIELNIHQAFANQAKNNFSHTKEYQSGYSKIKDSKINKIKTAAEIFIEYIK